MFLQISQLTQIKVGFHTAKLQFLLVCTCPLLSFLQFIFRRWCCEVCGWGCSLGAPAWPMFMWSGPTWCGIWTGPVGPCLEAGSCSAASLECQTFEVRLVKKKKIKGGRSLVKPAPVSKIAHRLCPGGRGVRQSLFP